MTTKKIKIRLDDLKVRVEVGNSMIEAFYDWDFCDGDLIAVDISSPNTKNYIAIPTTNRADDKIREETKKHENLDMCGGGYCSDIEQCRDDFIYDNTERK